MERVPGCRVRGHDLDDYSSHHGGGHRLSRPYFSDPQWPIYDERDYLTMRPAEVTQGYAITGEQTRGPWIEASNGVSIRYIQRFEIYLITLDGVKHKTLVFIKICNWFSTDFSKEKRLLCILKKLWRRTPTLTHYNLFLNQRTLYRKQIKTTKLSYYNKSQMRPRKTQENFSQFQIIY